MFNKLKEEKGLYEETPPDTAPKMVKCSICSEEIEEIQYARHVIKRHSGTK